LLVCSYLLIVGLFTTRAAHAQEQAWFQWRAPASCPAEEHVLRELVRWMGHAPTSAEVRLVQARGEVERTANGYKLTFSLRTSSGEMQEQHESPECVTLADVVALKLGVAMDPAGIVSVEAGSAREREVEAGEQIPEAYAETSRVRAPRAWGARVGLGLELSALPRLAPLADLTTARARGLWRGELGLRFGSTKVRHARRDDAGARLDLMALDVRGCAVARLAAWAMPFCLGFELGMLRGRGFGVIAETSNQWWQAVTFGPALHVPLRPKLLLVTALESVFTLARPSYRIESLGPLYRAPLLSARGLVAIERRWP